MVVEATASYEWFVNLLEPLAKRVVLAHPQKLRVIAESTRKNDKIDARILAEFLLVVRMLTWVYDICLRNEASGRAWHATIIRV